MAPRDAYSLAAHCVFGLTTELVRLAVRRWLDENEALAKEA